MYNFNTMTISNCFNQLVNILPNGFWLKYWLKKIHLNHLVFLLELPTNFFPHIQRLNKVFIFYIFNSKYYLLKASLICTIFSCLSILKILTSRKVVFLTDSSSSDSLNFFTATRLYYIFLKTYFVIFLISTF